jgi:hypothetical protein
MQVIIQGVNQNAALNATQTWTGNNTFNSGTLRATRPQITTSIDDSNGNKVINIVATASAVDSWQATNGATGTPGVVDLAAVGTDTNIVGTITAKGNGYISYTHNRVFAKPANPGNTTSTTLVMAGLGGSFTITPRKTGNVKVIMKGSFNMDAGVANCTIGGRYATGTPPINGAAVVGTAFDTDTVYTGDQNTKRGFVIMDYITGLTAGTAYNFDIAFATSAGADAANIINIVGEVEEL